MPRIKAILGVRILSIARWRDACLLAWSAKEGNSFEAHYSEPAVSLRLAGFMRQLFAQLARDNRDIVVLCIGTDRCTGDCLGPLVGTRLNNGVRRPFTVYGTLNDPVHAVNLCSILENIKERHHHPFIIAVDACLGGPERIGYINVREGALYPGTALKKSLPPVGDFHISGIVNVGGFMEHMVLQNTRLSLVFDMADVIARGLAWASW